MLPDSSHSPTVDCCFVAANANTVPRALDWLPGSRLVCFAAANLVHVATPERILFSLPGATGRINMLQWLPLAPAPHIAACSAAGELLIWKSESGADPGLHTSWALLLRRQIAKAAPVNYLRALLLEEPLSLSPSHSPSSQRVGYLTTFDSAGRLTLAALDRSPLGEGGAGGALSVDLEAFEPLEFGSRLQETVELVSVDASTLLVLVAGYDKLIHVYACAKREGGALSYQLSLAGHTNSITDLAAVRVGQSTLLASSSQDHCIRLWRLQELDKSAGVLADPADLDQFRSKKSYVLQLPGARDYSLSMESVLAGHQDAVASVRWGRLNSSLVLLSASFDFTVAVWRQSQDPLQQGLWSIEGRLGEVVGNKNAYFGAAMGGGEEDSHCAAILAYTYNGAFHYWTAEPQQLEQEDPVGDSS